MKRNMLVVVDMVNGFVNVGALSDKSINRIVPAIIDKIEEAKRNGDLIVFFRDYHKESDDEFKTYPPHCLEDSYESEIIDELKPYAENAVVIKKNTTNGFLTEEFAKIISRQTFDKIEVTGCCSDICVLDFATSALKYIKANSLDTKIFVSQSCIDTFHGEEHDPDQINRQSLMLLKKKGAKVEFAGKAPTHTKSAKDKKFSQENPEEKE